MFRWRSDWLYLALQKKNIMCMVAGTYLTGTTFNYFPSIYINTHQYTLSRYKLFAYLMLGRMEDSLEAMQPEEQHGFRQGRRIEEHLLTANVCLQKTLAASTPLWIISLDLSKAFDKIDWNALWSALRQHGISEPLIWILQCVYYGQTGVVRERDVDSRGFDIRGVLSPRLFSAVLEMALSSWRAKMEAEGLSLEDGLKPLLDLRFADDILVFCTTLDKACLLLDELVASLAEEGLTLSVKKRRF